MRTGRYSGDTAAEHELVRENTAAHDHAQWGKECGSVLGSHFQGSGRCENASGRLCLRTRHHVRAISTDGSCLLPQHCAKTTPCLSTTLFTLARPSPQAELTTSLQPNLYFPLPRNKVINKENYFQLVLTRGKKEREDK